MRLQSEYDQNGYVVMRDFLSTKELLRLTELVDDIHERWLTKNTTAFRENRLVNMHSLTHAEYFADEPRNRLRLFKAIAPAKLVELLDELFETEIHFHNTQLFFNPHDREQMPYWHRDLQFSPIDDDVQKMKQEEMLNLHVRIPLVKEMGLELIPGTHKRWDTRLERQVRLELEDHRNSEELPGSCLVDLAPGDVMIFNAQMIHRGHYTDNELRKALDLCVGRAHELVDSSLDPSVLPSTDELEQLKNDVWYQRSLSIVKSKL
ncbi:MAG: ectoine hydroxylase-related dioxygenase (phytanoyl-CoA dioxygenase family) [Candidatus Azotimanducaceae bacterium]|jgi:ectoine hydroxylase-related dioxygenase (phytanoyl-CoA dioxygenase family)